MEKRVGVIAIVVEDLDMSINVNEVLHKFSNIIVGRMGIPYKERGVSVISITVDGTMDDISALTGQLGKINQVIVKSAITKM